ncbi:hypothetical protein [Limosilactobacillus reuteri]|uniref:hypothetical protein n=1 Tax=Limosilactobacillus reuteri TaxID=1598 RepID=UPI00128C4DDA|nr:hypothetical protein [Limosilactobacillus reuteri]MQC01335.1 hypothetical protein [Limosilactobacillus reuteri]
MIPDVTPNGVFYLPPTGWLTSFYNPPKTYNLLQQYLPYIDYLKFNIHSFNKSANHRIDVTLAQWQRRSAIFNIEMIVGKIEDANHIALVNQLNIPFRQGYAYGHPENLKK